MNLNVTLFGEMITFAIFIWFTLKYVWPPITKALEERQTTIAASLENASKAKESLSEAKKQAGEIIGVAEATAKTKLDEAKYEGNQIIAAAKAEATKQTEMIYTQAKAECELMTKKAKDELTGDIAHLVSLAAQKILQRQVDEKIDSNIVNAVVSELKDE